MKVLVTAGSTEVPIDSVRCISNIFKGRTGTAIAKYFAEVDRRNSVTLLTSNSSLVNFQLPNLRVVSYRTFDDLARLLEQEVVNGDFGAIVHSAAVSDYRVARVLYMDEHGAFIPLAETGKISSTYPVLHLELVSAPKLIDSIRMPWGFSGVLVKFKLQVDESDAGLLEIAKKSRRDSSADIIVANCLAWAAQYAYVIGRNSCVRVTRDELPKRLYEKICSRLAR